MEKDTNSIREKAPAPSKLDEKDRKLLALLAEDASQSYAQLGRQVHLSAPAVHERVKRLKNDGVKLGCDPFYTGFENIARR